MAQTKPGKVIVDISSMTLFKILLIIVVVAFLFYVKDIAMMLFVSLILAATINPSVDWMQKNKIPRVLGIALIYVLVLSALFFSFYLILNPLTSEIKNLSKDFPIYWEKVSAGWHEFDTFSKNQGWQTVIEDSLLSLQTGLASLASNFFGGIISFIGSIFSLLVILVMTFYLSLYDQSMKKKARSFLPPDKQPYFIAVINRMQEKIGFWLRGQLLLSLIIFALSLVGLLALGVKYAWVLALFAGITEFIPYLGPFIGAVPAIFIAFTQDPTLGFYVLILYIAIQQAENNIIVPLLMKKAVGLNPVVVIVAMLVGAKVAGIAGVLLAVPVTTAIGVIASDIFGRGTEKDIA